MTVGAVSYLAGFLAYLFLSALLLVSWRGNVTGRWLVLASSATAVWSGLLAMQETYRLFPAAFVWSAEIVRTYIWLLFFGKLLSPLKDAGIGANSTTSKIINQGIHAAAGAQLVYVWVSPALERSYPEVFRPAFQLFGHIGLALIGLILIEQYFRNIRTDLRWRIKFVCFALGGMFAYDFYLYSDALLFQRINPDLWMARGAVSALLTPFLAVSAARNPQWSVDVFVSRQVVFHSATLVGAGVYLLLMATAGYYIKIYGGEWGTVAQIVFLVGAFLLLALLLFSGQMRARMRVFLSKNFFNYAYDYRQEWLRIITTLSDTRSGLLLEERVIVALGQAVESPSGTLWVREPNGHFVWRASFGDPDINVPHIDRNDPVIRYMEDKEWIVNLPEMVTMPEAYHGLIPPVWLEPNRSAWLLVPLFQQKNRLSGLVLLTRPRTAIHWNWEVIDLLKTSSRLAASYLALEDAGRALTEARQFEGFNRLSAFVIHDLKNLIAQLSLVVRNAERHHNNPEFMRDAIKTVDHAVGKMSRLMSQLKNSSSAQSEQEIELGELLGEVVESRKVQAPIPSCDMFRQPIVVKANRDRLASSFEHIIHNAQDAAGKNGRVSVRMSVGKDGHATVDIEDNGQGMDEEFIRTRLFKPFETTKGLTGMGIGAYESREYIRSLGGELSVRSVPDKSTLFSFTIPIASKSDELVLNEVKSA
ncbi:XrtA/PEP-CTERM system histidine kinase PrsK [Methylocaldum sp.]|uniref:XrtA/PEP-CTERM system histidine kinase PrsK n=1 Tax=Methylocaldum sp. TaxID=1969727 RepID=UPI002D603C6B|nr:XrtA/PEP-CTERM system histidine kinase PrsK [Methylocaldum sp.]HYE36836.1 XrtA/PEP-CTERM system histidine kinase PrsK [Methylocaldum sp.]